MISADTKFNNIRSDIFLHFWLSAKNYSANQADFFLFTEVSRNMHRNALISPMYVYDICNFAAETLFYLQRGRPAALRRKGAGS